MKSNLLKYCLLMSVFLGVPSKNIYARNTKTETTTHINHFSGGLPKKPERFEDPAPSTEKPVDVKEYDPQIYQTQYFQSLYFANLADNIGINNHGTCGYVASAAILSYFDTYWDDNVIETKFEKKEELITDYRNHLKEKYYNSPGIIHEPWEEGSLKLTAPFDLPQYLKNIEEYKNQYFMFLLESQQYALKLRIPCVEDFSWDSFTDDQFRGDFNMTADGPAKLLNWYLHEYRGYTTNQVEVTTSYTDLNLNNVLDFNDQKYRQIAIENIKQGKPVILALYDYSRSEAQIYGHYVVAYDYDAKTNRIFFNNLMQGCENTHAHIGYKMMQWEGIAGVTVVDFKTPHSHSDNYRVNGVSRCSCVLQHPYDIQVNTYVDKQATITWKTAYQNEKWFNNDTKYYYINVAQSTNLNPAYTVATFTTSSNEYTLSRSESKVFADYSRLYVMVGISTNAENDLWKTNFEFATAKRPEVNNSNYYYYSYSNRYVKLTQGSKSGSTWTITVENNTIFPLYVWYNKKMCFYNDGINWNNLSNLATKQIQPFQSAKIEVTTNWFADSIAVSHNFNTCSATRYITVCKNPSNGSLNNTYNAK